MSYVKRVEASMLNHSKLAYQYLFDAMYSMLTEQQRMAVANGIKIPLTELEKYAKEASEAVEANKTLQNAKMKWSSRMMEQFKKSHEFKQATQQGASK